MVDRLLLPNILPEHAVGVPLYIKVIAKGLDGFPRWEDRLEVPFAALLFFIVRQNGHVVLSQLREAIEERRNDYFVANAVRFCVASFDLVRGVYFRHKRFLFDGRLRLDVFLLH